MNIIIKDIEFKLKSGNEKSEDFIKEVSNFLDYVLDKILSTIPASDFKTSELLEFDKDTTINWACIWNDISNVGKECKVIATSNILTLVYIPEI